MKISNTLDEKPSKKMVAMVKKNSMEVDKYIVGIIDAHPELINKFIVYHDGVGRFEDSYIEAVKIGKEIFGNDIGFCIKKVSSVPIVLSKYVKKI